MKRATSYGLKALAITGLCLWVFMIIVIAHALLTKPSRSRTVSRSPSVQPRLPAKPVAPPHVVPYSKPQTWVPAPVRPPSLSTTMLPDDSLTNFSSNLPLVVIDTGRKSIYNYGEILVTARLIAPDHGRARLTGSPDYAGRALIKIHGTSTARLPKKSFNFHPVDEKTNQVKIPIFGLPSEEDWVLYAPYEDKTMLRDVLAYDLCRRMGHYAPRTRYVEVFLNTSGQPLSWRDYVGVYVIVEKIKRGKNRVNVEKLEPTANSEPDISGGYIFKRDHPDEGGGFYTRNGGPYFHVYPKAANITPAQRSWLIGYLTKFENALSGPSFADPKKGYAAYLDVACFIDAHWLIELSKNVDGFRYSSFLTKERNGKLRPEPPWDWNRSFGNADYHGGWDVESWYWPYLRSTEICWYARLQDDPAFRERCADRWFELRRTVFDSGQIAALIDQLTAELAEAQRRNYQRWPILGRQVTCNYYVGNSFEDEVRWLKNWINQRINWIDGQLRLSPNTSSKTLQTRRAGLP